MVVKFLRLDFDVLAQGIKAQPLHSQDVVRIAFGHCRGVDAVGPVTLIQQTVEKVGFAVEQQSGDAIYHPGFNAPDGKVGIDPVVSRLNGKLV